MTEPAGTEALLAQAIEHHRNRRLDEAAQLYDAVLKAEPEHVHALSVSAILMFERGLRSQAIDQLKRAIALAPDQAELLNNLGTMLKIENRRDEAIEAWSQALAIDPDQPQALCNIALVHRAAKRFSAARDCLERAIALDPFQVEANHNLGELYVMECAYEKAAECFERCYAQGQMPIVSPMHHVRLLRKIGQAARADEIMRLHAEARPDDPIVVYEAAAILGQAQDAAPTDYVRAKFDQFAETFDTALEEIGYQAPQRIAEAVRALCGDAVVPLIVDLGCGTGLAGPGLRANARHLIGVDLSVAMMERASVRQSDGRPVYDQLIEMDITEFLEGIPRGSVHVAVAADTLVYFGNLQPVFVALGRAIRRGGAFVSSFEQAADETAGGFALLESGRFAHADRYVAEIAEAAGFAVRRCDPCALRREFGKPVASTLQIFEKITDPPD